MAFDFGFRSAEVKSLLAETCMTRREAIKLAAGSAAGIAMGACQVEGAASAAAGGTLVNPLFNSSAIAIAAAIRSSELSSTEAVDLFLARIDEVNPQLNAVFQIQAAKARVQAQRADEIASRGESLGPFHGVPMTIKDSLDTEGVISTGGMTGRATFVPQRDATAVRRLRDAGAILLGACRREPSFRWENLLSGNKTPTYGPKKARKWGRFLSLRQAPRPLPSPVHGASQ